jgi:hypothetical protein
MPHSIALKAFSRRLAPLVGLVVLTVASPFAFASEGTEETVTRGELLARWNAAHGDAYPLDGVERFIELSPTTAGKKRPRIQCDDENLVLYPGTTVRYAGPLRVHPAFRDRLERFEALVTDVSKEVYGRAPRRIRHYGSYSCRTSRARSYRISEHALGNALDVVGFDFGPLTKKDGPFALPKGLKGPFEVRVARHWNAPSNGARGTAATETAALHAHFLHLLTRRIEERRDVFRILIGPGHGSHKDHFHFDMSPWNYVDL